MPRMPNKVHQVARQRQRPQRTNWLRNPEDAKFYNTAAWRKLSIAYKMRNPVCEIEGCNKTSYYTDHIVPVSEGGDKWDSDNLQALCKSCNGSKTAKQNQSKINYNQ